MDRLSRVRDFFHEIGGRLRGGGRRLIGALLLATCALLLVRHPPLGSVGPGEIGVRINHLTGGVREVREGWTPLVPGVHELRRYPLRDQIYRPERSARAEGEAPFQSIEGLSLGLDVTVRYALDPSRVLAAARALPANLGADLVQPVADGIIHRVVSRHTVREIFSSKRAEIQDEIERDLREALARDGVVVRALFVGNVDLPKEYREGLEALLAEELATEKMGYTLELKQKQIQQSQFEAEAEKARREQAAEAAGLEEIIAAKSRAEAMKHVLPWKEKEIEQKRLEAEAAKVERLKQAEAQSESRKIEAEGEAQARRKLAEADAFRIDVTGKANSDQLARDSELIAKNPLLIQKTLADKLSDKIQVIVAPPSAGGFFAGGLLAANAAARPPVAPRGDDP